MANTSSGAASGPSNKGYDDSPPRNGIIFFYAFLTVFVLIGVKFLLDSYFANMLGAELQEKVYTAGLEEVKEVRQQEAEKLQKGSMPIDQAMRLLGQRGRSASPVIAPQGGNAPEVGGWSQLKREVAPVAAVQPSPAAPAAAPEAPKGHGH